MIPFSRFLRLTSEAMRRRRPDAEQRQAERDRDAELRAALEARERVLRVRARDLLTLGLRSERAAGRDCLLFHAAAAAARAEALHMALGGDHETAAALTVEAEQFDRLAGQRATQPMAAAHA